MRYMLLIYTKEQEGATDAERAAIVEGHRAVMAETKRRGILIDAAPLEATSTATTIRVANGRPLVCDGPFAETKEQLAGYYILDCRDLDEAIEWATKIPTGCQGGEGCVEIRPFRARTTTGNG